MIDPNFIDQCFPKPSYRPQQKEVIQSIIHCINSGKKYIIAELPTGTGKSPIAVTLARLVESAYYITTTKILQDQIENDFGDSIATLKGRSNYPCTVYDNFKNELRKQLGTNLVEQDASLKPSCSEGHCKKRLGSSKCRLCVPTKIEIEENPLPNGLQHSYCPYYERYYRAANSKIASMNFDNFILHLNYGKTFGNRKLLIIDECLHPHTYIQTEVGRIPIGKLVNNRINVKVASWNFGTNKIEYKPIVRWLKRDKNLTFKVLAGNSVFYPTSDHKIYTPTGKKKLSELNVGDEVITRNYQITYHQKQLVLGSLLGDASLNIVNSKRVSKKYVNKGTRARVKFRHGPKQFDYLSWKYKILINHAKTAPKLKNSSGFTKLTASFSTSCEFYDIIKPTLINDVKSPNFEWLNEIDEFGLAVWYMDDGGLTNNVARFHSNDFTYCENECLVNWLFNKFGIRSSIKTAKKKDGKSYYYVSLYRDSTKLLASLIAKYVPNNMRYKLPSSEYDEYDEYDNNIEIQDCCETSVSKILSIEPYKETVTYDLEVADNHNYFAGNTLVSNCHNTEEKLLNFLETTISSKHINNRIPKLETPLEYINWLKRIDATGTLKERYEEARGSLNIKLMQHYENLLMKYVNFIIEVTNDPTGWVVEYSTENDEDIVSAKPIFAKSAAKKLLFSHADIIIFLSATILNANTFANNLGINKDEYSAYRIGSNFPVENRPIILDYAGKFTGGKDKQQIWIKPLTRKVEEIARNFPNERGIIHTHSFGIQKGIVENAALDVRKRFLEQHNFINKTEMLEHHAKTPGSIIIAPAMHEGIDLKDDLSRFQILCKVPYANYYENIQLMARMELDPPYYEYITIMKLVQSVGRSVRSETDWAYTYIIDESFERIYKTNNSFPLWFKEAVTKNLKSKINVGS